MVIIDFWHPELTADEQTALDFVYDTRNKFETGESFCDKYFTALYCTALQCTVLYCTVLYCTVLYCTVLYCTVLYCTVM